MFERWTLYNPLYIYRGLQIIEMHFLYILCFKKKEMLQFINRIEAVNGLLIFQQMNVPAQHN